MRRIVAFPLAVLATLAALPAIAGTCSVDIDAVETSIATLEQDYGDVLSDISCDFNTNPAREMMCDAAYTLDSDLWRMGRLADLAWVYAYETATGQQVDLANPPRNDTFIAIRDACTDAACLCAALIEDTNSNLGAVGTPYPY